jgi:glycosyltransferase involved in cell wall biosynthesis
MKVAFVITGLATGGAERMLHKLLTHSPTFRDGVVVSLRCGGELEDRIRSLGVPVDCLGMRPGVPAPTAMWRLCRLLRRSKPDVVSSWMYHADLLAGLAASIVRIPLVWGIRNSDFDRTTTKWTTRFVIQACARLSAVLPNRIISCSTVARDVHVHLGYKADRFTVIPNGFDVQNFRPSPEARADIRQELDLSSETKLVGLIARFDPQKNHRGFLEAAREVHQHYPDARFLMVGEGVTLANPYLRSQLQRCGLEGVAFMLGQRSDMERVIASLDALVVSSSYGEAFPNVVGEAMACGVPCIVTDVGDAAFVVGDTGIVAPPRDMLALAQGICRVLGLAPAEWRALGERARARVIDLFEIGAVARQYESLFRSVAKSRPAAGRPRIVD